MSDHETLRDAFAEYERRADAVSAARASDTDIQPARARRAARTPVLLVAASVVAVLAVAAAVVGFAGGFGGHGSGGAQAGGPAPASSAAVSTPPGGSSDVPGSATPSGSPSATPSDPPSDTGSDTPSDTGSDTPSDGSSAAAGPTVPADAEQMEQALRRALGDTATFTVTETHGNYIIGVLTASSSGDRGGFDIQASAGDPGDKAFCEDADTSHCRIVATPGGGSLATGHEPTQDGGTLYLVDYVHPNGVNVLMHLSNLADPKGAGHSYGDTPPLTEDQVVAVLESATWDQP